MKKTIVERMIRNYITSAVGIVLMIFSALYFWKNIEGLTLENILIGGALAAVGFIFLWVKDSLITSFLPKR